MKKKIDELSVGITEIKDELRRLRESNEFLFNKLNVTDLSAPELFIMVGIS